MRYGTLIFLIGIDMSLRVQHHQIIRANLRNSRPVADKLFGKPVARACPSPKIPPVQKWNARPMPEALTVKKSRYAVNCRGPARRQRENRQMTSEDVSLASLPIVPLAGCLLLAAPSPSRLCGQTSGSVSPCPSGHLFYVQHHHLLGQLVFPARARHPM